MKELRLLDLHPDKTSLVLLDDEGERYLLPVTDELRDALRPQRSSLEAVKTRIGADAPSVRDIQSLVRMGSTAAEIAEQFGLPIDHVERYESPIIYERNYVADKARNVPIGGQPDAPVLEELVVDRLAARGVDASSISWDAVRQGEEPWEIICRFVQSATQKEARWNIDSSFHNLNAINEEAIWLTETSATRSDPFGLDAPLPWEKEELDAKTVRPHFPQMASDALMEELNAKRGIRQDLDMDEFDDEDELLDDADSDNGREAQVVDDNADGDVVPLNPTDTDDTGDKASPDTDTSDDDATGDTSDSDNSDDDPVTGTLPGFENVGTHDATAPKDKKRRSVPSFDEIFFGPRSD